MSRTSMKVSALAGALLLSLTACSGGSGASVTPTSNSSSRPSPGVATSSSGPQTLPSSTSGRSTPPSWSVPQPLDGWRIEEREEQGLIVGANEAECKFLVSRTHIPDFPDPEQPERELSGQFRDVTTSAMQEDEEITDLNYADSADSLVVTREGKEVEGVTLNASYVRDGVKITGWYWFRVVSDPSFGDLDPIAMAVYYRCPEDAYSIDGARSLITEKLKLDYLPAGTESMDG